MLGASTGKLCPNCGVKLSGRINELTNKAVLAPEAKAAQKELSEVPLQGLSATYAYAGASGRSALAPDS